MSFNIITISGFDKQLKRLSKKYSSIKQDLAELEKQLSENTAIGEPLGHNCYKIRLAITSKGKGKSGGARIIACVRIIQNNIYLLTMYDKSEQSDISDSELRELLSMIDLD